jgi:hypothetical protein
MLVEMHMFPFVFTVKSMLVFTKMHFDQSWYGLVSSRTDRCD